MKKAYIGFSIGVFAVCVFLIIVLATGVWKDFLHQEEEELLGTRIGTPLGINTAPGASAAQLPARDESLNTRVPMENGEFVIAVLDRESSEGFSEEQYVVYFYMSDAAGTIYITCIKYDESSGRHRRMWSDSTVATRPETVSIFIQDLIGDRNNCIIVTGMNGQNEHTMTIFRNSPGLRADQPYRKIAELQVDGSIIIQEVTRSLAYHQGITTGQSFSIAAYGHDSSSNNILDQLETIYTFNSLSEQYQQANVSRIPGSQIEQRRLRELLSGVPGVFENFLNDLWYYVSPQGTIDTRQYIYFNPDGREIIFYGDETQQVFRWQNSMPTRNGLYVTCQNQSISTLRRALYIELESLDSIRLRAVEDLQFTITVSATWDGTYRRARTRINTERESPIRPAINAVYNSLWGRLQFHDTGFYSLTSGGSAVSGNGRYVFFKVDDHDLLELRPDNAGEGTEGRMVYKVDPAGDSAFVLIRVRLGTTGVQEMLETPVMLTPVESD